MFVRTEGSAAEHVEIVGQDEGQRRIGVVCIFIQQREGSAFGEAIAGANFGVVVIDRVIDGALGANLLQAIKDNLENPMTMLA